MTKLTNLDEKMSIRIDSELKDQVIAYGFVVGFEGSYSDTIRYILRNYLPQIVDGLPEEKKKEYLITLEQLGLIRKQKMELLDQPIEQENTDVPEEVPIP